MGPNLERAGRVLALGGVAEMSIRLASASGTVEARAFHEGYAGRALSLSAGFLKRGIAS